MQNGLRILCPLRYAGTGSLCSRTAFPERLSKVLYMTARSCRSQRMTQHVPRGRYTCAISRRNSSPLAESSSFGDSRRREGGGGGTRRGGEETRSIPAESRERTRRRDLASRFRYRSARPGTIGGMIERLNKRTLTRLMLPSRINSRSSACLCRGKLVLRLGSVLLAGRYVSRAYSQAITRSSVAFPVSTISRRVPFSLLIPCCRLMETFRAQRYGSIFADSN